MDDLTDELSLRTYFIFVVTIVTVSIITLQLMGRPWLHPSGTLKLWEGDIYSSHISQHLTDWYIFTHLIHGILLYGLLWLILPDVPAGSRLLIAVAVEALWEIIENTDYVIRFYRNNTVAVKFYGDTILNSFMDQLAMIAGFLTAKKLPVYVTVIFFVSSELVMLYFTRDSFLLNVLMLLFPLETVKNWQLAI